MTEDKAFQLIMGAVARIEEKVDSIDDKLDNKVESLHSEISRIDVRCAGNQVCNTGIAERVKNVETSVKSIQEIVDKNSDDIQQIKRDMANNEWGIFFRTTTKLAVFVVLVGGALLFVYQVFEKARNPAAPMPSMPSIP